MKIVQIDEAAHFYLCMKLQNVINIVLETHFCLQVFSVNLLSLHGESLSTWEWR